MKLPKIAINNFQFTSVIFILLLIAGVYSYLNIPRTENPSIYIPGASVVVIHPGTNPTDMEQLIALPIEEAINELDDIKKINTTLQDGLAIVNVEFIFGTDAQDKFDEVVQKVNNIRDELPEDLYKLDINKWTSTDVAIMQLAFVADSIEFSIMESEAEQLKDELEKVFGVKKINIVACPQKEVRVSLDLEKMAQMNISLNDVEQAIQSNNVNIPGGSVDIGSKNFNIKSSGSYNDLYELERTVVKSFQGKIIYLKDIATVGYDYEDNKYLAKFNGRRAIFMEIQQKEGINIFDIMDGINPKMEAFKKTLNHGITLHTVFDQSEIVSDRINGFLGNLGQGILLVGILILLALGFKSALIVIIAIPLSVIIGLGIVDSLDFGLQQISIAGLVVALGLLVDNSIVIVENINRYINLGYKPKEAAIKGASEIGWAIVSATATTIMAFIPIVMMPDKTGDFIKSLPVTIIATLLVSLFIALTLNPLIISKVFKSKEDLEKKRKEKLARKPTTKKSQNTKGGNFFSRHLKSFIEGPYRKTLLYSLRNKGLTIFIALAMFIGTIVIFITAVGVSFFPPAETPQLLIRAHLPEGANLSKSEEVATYIESVLDTTQGVKHYATNVGHGNPRIYYNIFPKNFTKNFADIYVQLEEFDYYAFREMITNLRNTFRGYTNADIYIKVFEQSPPQQAPLELYLIGKDIDVLKEISKDIESYIKDQEGAINIVNQLDMNKTDLYFNINKDKASMLGVPIFMIDKTIRAAVSGITVSDYRDNTGEEFDIVLRMPEGDSIRISDFQKIYVPAMTGKQIPLNQLASLEFRKAPGIITRFNMERTAILMADIKEGASLDEIVDAVTEKLDSYNFPRGYSYYWAGEVEARQESFGGMQRAVLIALIAIFAILVLQFRSFTQPLIIYAAIPLAIIGSVLALLITGYTFSFTAFIGLTSLVGIVINNSIILVDYTNQLRAEGMDIDQALQNSGETRFTPIILTTLTTIGGLLPLTLAGGEMWAPLGWTIIGGLLMSTVLTLIVVPVLYRLLSSKERFTNNNP